MNMHWNFRVLKYKRGDVEYYKLAEVYYETKNEDKRFGYVDVDLSGFESIDEMKEYYELVKDAFNKPALDVTKFE